MNLSYVIVGSEVLARLAIVPYLVMAGGVVIANQLGLPVSQNFALFMAVNSIIGFPWLARAGVDLLYGHIVSLQQKAMYDEYMEAVRASRVDALTGSGEVTQPSAAETKSAQ